MPSAAPASSDAQIVQTLLDARRSGQVADAAPVVIADAAQAYRVQAAVSEAMGWFGGAPARHWKSGGPSRDVVLTHAPLPPAGVWASPADARAWPFHWRGIEAEIALRLAQPVDQNLAQRLDHESARALVDAMAVAIELVDSRWAQALQAPALHKLCDLQSHGALVLGEWVPLRAVDWAAQRCELHIGDQVQVFTGTHSLGDPTWLLPQWLRHACAQHGTLAAGTVVTTGTWVGIVPAERGDKVVAVFDGIGEASLQL